VEEAIGEKVAIPDSIESIMHKEKKFHQISNYDELKSYLLS
jgi:threonine synthase